VFHNIRFNTIKKGKDEAEGNGFIHQLSNHGDEMKKMQDGNSLSLPLAYERHGTHLHPKHFLNH